MTLLTRRMQRYGTPKNPLKVKYWPMGGGLNIVDPVITLQPGELLAVENYEISTRGGYRRIDGFERFDGRNKPSEASYWTVPFDAGTTAINEGDLVGDSGSPTIQGEALIDAVVESGSFAGNDAAGYLVLMKVQGKTAPSSFSDNDALYVGAGQVATVNGAVTERGASTDALDDTYIQDAIETTRADIGTVTGSGDILGVWVYNGDVYAFRNNAGGTASVMYKATTSGWSAQSLGNYLKFDQGGSTYQIASGDVVKGNSSSASMTTTAVAVRTGSIAGGDAEGLFTAASVSGTFTDNENLESDHIAFDVGTIEISDGDTVTGGTSTETAVVTNVVVTSGDWATGDAAGYLTVKSSTGTFTDGENLEVGGTKYAEVNGASQPTTDTIAVANGTNTAITLPANGRYEFVNYNFGGAAGTIKMYGVNGQDFGFEWDGSVFVPIFTGSDTDTPIHVTAHKKHLFFAFPNGSVQHSSIAEPYEWSPVTGAAELGTADEVTGMLVLPGDVLAIFNRNRTYLLYGTSSSDWNLQTFSDESGAIEWTIQRMFNAVYMDDRGITSLAAVQEYGDFQDATLSDKVQPIIDDKRAENANPENAAVRVKSKNQYRIYFTDNTGLVLTFDRFNVIGTTYVDYGKPVKCICSGEDSNGNEVLFFGSDDGYVYQLDKGTSFDGSELVSYLRTAYYHYETPTMEKRFRNFYVEVDAGEPITLQFQANYSYSDTESPEARVQTHDLSGGGGFWNEDNWNEFYWSADVVSKAEGYLDGQGTNMSLLIRLAATYDVPHIVQGVTVHFAPRRIRR